MRQFTTKYLTYLVLGIVLLISCSKESTIEIVAKWNDIKITLPDFERSYFQNWMTTHKPDSPELRREFAQKMIEQEIIANPALSSKLVDEKIIEEKLKQQLSRFVRQRYLEITIKDTIGEISENDIQTALERQNQKLRVRQLYARTKEGIKKFATRLGAGETFELLARETIPDEKMAANAGDMGWIGWGDTDLPVEELLYTLKRGEISQPVQSLMGWHIFRIDSQQTVIIFSQDQLLKSDVKAKLFNRKLDMASAFYLRKLVWSKELAINVKLFKPVWDYIFPLLPKSPQERATKPMELICETAPLELSEQTIATIDGEPFTVAEFLTAIPDLPRNLLKPNFKKAIEIAVRDKILFQEAMNKKINLDPVVKEKMNRSKITFSYYAALAANDTMSGKKVNLRSLYEENKRRYIDYIETEIEEILVKNRAKAIELAKIINAGKKFSDLARQHSMRSETKNNGGYLGYVSSKSDPIGRKAAKLQKGDLFAPIETEDGFSVIRAGNRRIAYLPFDDVKKQVAHDAQRDYYNVLHRSLLPDSYSPTDIQYFEENLTKALTLESETIF